jgi:hypothetical protein
MAELVAAIATYSVWLYLVLAVLMARELRAMWWAGTERDRAAFGVEREAAASKGVRSLVTLLLLVTITAGIYTITNVIAPTLPEAELRRLDGAPIVAEPPRAPVPTDTPTPEPTPTRRLPRIVTAVPEGPTATPGP